MNLYMKRKKKAFPMVLILEASPVCVHLLKITTIFYDVLEHQFALSTQTLAGDLTLWHKMKHGYGKKNPKN